MKQFKSFPHFLYLLPLFFVFHGYVQNSNAVAMKEVFELWGEYLLAAAILTLLGYVLFRQWNKAAVFAFGSLFFHLFFGAIVNGLKTIAALSFLTKYSVVLPLVVVGVVLFIYYLKKTKRNFLRFAVYANLLFLVLIAVDVVLLLSKKSPQPVLTSLQRCDTCNKPDVYFIVADEYADSISLVQAFGFDNGTFQNELRKRGFYIVEGSKSNYNFTQHSIASLFKMDYLQNIQRINSSLQDIDVCYGTINNNELLLFFQKNGYAIRNFSVFNVANQPAKAQYKFVPMGKQLLSAQTFLQRVYRDLGYHLVTTFKLQWQISRYTYYAKETNTKLVNLLLQEAATKSVQPRFVFTHLEMPHYPYYFDKRGKPRPLDFLTAAGNEFNTSAYVEYLQYCNQIFLNLIDQILANSTAPPIIVFMSDHGFREFGNEKPETIKYHFMNFNSVYLHGKNYTQFYNGITGVNQFRALLNTSFGQNLPLLKDSLIYVRD